MAKAKKIAEVLKPPVRMEIESVIKFTYDGALYPTHEKANAARISAEFKAAFEKAYPLSQQQINRDHEMIRSTHACRPTNTKIREEIMSFIRTHHKTLPDILEILEQAP